MVISPAATVYFYVTENEIQNKQVCLEHFPLFPIPPICPRTTFFSFFPSLSFSFFFFSTPTGGYVVWNMLICYAPATPWVKITY